MSQIDELLNADNPTEFFITMYHLAKQRQQLNYFLNIRSASYRGRRALQFPVHQMVTHLEDGESIGWGTEDVHTFTLVDNDEIIWEIKGQEPIIGLENIKAVLQQLRDTAQANSRNDHRTGADNLAGLLSVSPE